MMVTCLPSDRDRAVFLRQALWPCQQTPPNSMIMACLDPDFFLWNPSSPTVGAQGRSAPIMDVFSTEGDGVLIRIYEPFAVMTGGSIC